MPVRTFNISKETNDLLVLKYSEKLKKQRKLSLSAYVDDMLYTGMTLGDKVKYEN